MTELIDEVLFYLDHNPVLPPLVCLYCIICSIPVVILLIATQNCAIHRNCRYLISLWSLSLIGFLVNVASLYLEMLTFDNGYLPRNLIDPPLRRYFLAVHSMFYVCSSSFEMYIALERIVSTRQPHAYHVREEHWTRLVPVTIATVTLRRYFLAVHSMFYVCSSSFEMYIALERIVSTRQPHAYHVREEHWTRLVPVTIATYIFGAYVGYLIYIIDNHLTGLLIYNAIDISTLVINKFGIYYCKRRYNALYGKASLNARYQISGILIAYTYVLLMSHFTGPIYALLDAGYFLIHSFNCAISATFLICRHKSLRKSTITLMGRKRIEHFSNFGSDGSLEDMSNTCI